VALEKTKNQLEALKKANVVDSGAKGFTYFIEGALYYIKTGEEIDSLEDISYEEDLFELDVHSVNSNHEKYRYCTECLLQGNNIDTVAIKEFLSGKGDSTVVASNKDKCRIHIHTNDPADVFDYLHEIGTIVYQKIDDMVKQKDIVNNRKHNIALITDSIADVPKHIIDHYQIHVVHLDILINDRTYMDKLTIKPNRLLDLADDSKNLPTSSQPSPKQIENLYDYLSTYYESAIVMTVSKELSGTYNNFKKIGEQYREKDFKISVINTKQNSVAEGLLIKKCAELIDKGISHNQVVKEIEKQIQGSKMLVQVETLDNMIKSGRLNVKIGNIGKRIGMKPIVTLDSEGKGALDSITFSTKGSNKKILSHLRAIIKKKRIKEYAIVHVNNIYGANLLGDLVKKIIGYDPEYIEETSSIVAVGAGQGAVAIAYLLDEEVA
jgi:DegV family protein with EDD domain